MQAQAPAQLQAGPQLHWLGAASQPHGGGHWQGLQLQSVFIWNLHGSRLVTSAF